MWDKMYECLTTSKVPGVCYISVKFQSFEVVVVVQCFLYNFKSQNREYFEMHLWLTRIRLVWERCIEICIVLEVFRVSQRGITSSV